MEQKNPCAFFMKEDAGSMRTLAFQVPDDLFRRIKDYLQRNNMTQKEFIIGLIETKLDRDMAERESVNEAQADDSEQTEEIPKQKKMPLWTILKPIPAKTNRGMNQKMKIRDFPWEWECEVKRKKNNGRRSDAIWQSDFLICSQASADSGQGWKR